MKWIPFLFLPFIYAIEIPLWKQLHNQPFWTIVQYTGVTTNAKCLHIIERVISEFLSLILKPIWHIFCCVPDLPLCCVVYPIWRCSSLQMDLITAWTWTISFSNHCYIPDAKTLLPSLPSFVCPAATGLCYHCWVTIVTVFHITCSCSLIAAVKSEVTSVTRYIISFFIGEKKMGCLQLHISGARVKHSCFINSRWWDVASTTVLEQEVEVTSEASSGYCFLETAKWQYKS